MPLRSGRSFNRPIASTVGVPRPVPGRARSVRLDRIALLQQDVVMVGRGPCITPSALEPPTRRSGHDQFSRRCAATTHF